MIYFRYKFKGKYIMDLVDFVPFDKWIKKEDMIKGEKYFCEARNFTEAVWNGESFEYERHKFGSVFKDNEYHWDDGAPFGTVKPLKKIEQ